MPPPRLNFSPYDQRVTDEIARRRALNLPTMSDFTMSRAHTMSAETLDRNIREFVAREMVQITRTDTNRATVIHVLAEALTAPYSFPVLTPELAKLQALLGLSNSYTTEEVERSLDHLFSLVDPKE